MAGLTSPMELILVVALILTPTSAEAPVGAVVTNGPPCAKIGTSILEQGGTAVDAAIAALFCEGVCQPNSMGLGGGFFMNIYLKDTREAKFLISREVAPNQANETMYKGDLNLATRGGLAVAVPGELRGYWEAYNAYGGGVEWKALVHPSIELCEEGILVTEYLERIYSSHEEIIRKDDILRETFIDPTTNKTYAENSYVKRPRLAETLRSVALEGPDVLYNGSMTLGFVKEIQDKGGIITEEDLFNYKPEWREPIRVDLPFNQTLYTSPLPGSGVILGFILTTLRDLLDFSQPDSLSNWQRIVEAFKFGFAKRADLGDPEFVYMMDILSNLTDATNAEAIRKKIFDNSTSQFPEDYGANVTQPPDHGTANLCVLAPNGDAVVVTSTINLDFGAGFMSNSTGIIFNDQMDDFSSLGFNNSFGVPPSPNNYISPGKTPVSSMSPSIVVGDNGEVRLLVGGAGGTRIITSVVLTMIRNLWYNYTVKDAVAEKRLHHQLFPMELLFEQQYTEDMDLVEALGRIGHVYRLRVPDDGSNAVTSISREKGTVKASFDPRRGGAEEYVYGSGVVPRLNLLLCGLLVMILSKLK